MDDITKRWEKYGRDHLLGKTVTTVRYLTAEEAEQVGFYRRPIIIEFNDGTVIFPSADDEGNDAGALFGGNTAGDELTFPVL